ncbi:MAG: hypothetical protein ABSD96_20790 [Candidatus Korobacteraceae bacterium]|jgi:hypothetical protein
MAEINLLIVPVILPPALRMNSASTSLVPVSRFPTANQIVPRSDSAYPDDNFAWSVSTGDNGSFHFYAVPLKNFLNGGTSSQDGFQSPYAFAPNRNALNANAVAQYRLMASMTTPMHGQMLSVYA